MTTENLTAADLKVTPFDVVEFLDSDEAIAAYIEAALEENDAAFFMSALNDVVRARGIAAVAKQAGLGRESLYKTLKSGAEPKFDTVMRLLGALNVRLSAAPISNDKHAKNQAVGPSIKKIASKRATRPSTATQEPIPAKPTTPKAASKSAGARRAELTP